MALHREDVLTRHRWMRDVLMPVLSAALGRMERGIDLTAMMAQGMTMGDEFHQRNIVSPALLMRALARKLYTSIMMNSTSPMMDFLSVTNAAFPRPRDGLLQGGDGCWHDDARRGVVTAITTATAISSGFG
ncbi:DUF1116 domain-containing protein [Escherichia coli]